MRHVLWGVFGALVVWASSLIPSVAARLVTPEQLLFGALLGLIGLLLILGITSPWGWTRWGFEVRKAPSRLPKPLEDQALAAKQRASRFRVRIANALQGAAADCVEPFFDCLKLVITNDGTDCEIEVAVRPNGAAPRLWLVREGSREREFTIHRNDHVNVPLFVRTRRD